MKLRVTLILFIALIQITPDRVRAQDSGSALQRLQDLRGQLSDVEYRQADLNIRLQQLDNDLKPENIERHFQGYGSTRPEELRESRRRQLTIERDHIRTQLDRLTTDHSRLTAAISEAQAKAYQDSAQSAARLTPDPNRRAKIFTAARTVVAIGVLVVVVGSLGLRAAMRRRRPF